jgi:hypothetical protein
MGWTLTHIKAKVAWNDCYARLQKRWANLTNLEVVKISLLVKWVVKAFDEGTPTYILRFRLWSSRQDLIDKWRMSPWWMLLR